MMDENANQIMLDIPQEQSSWFGTIAIQGRVSEMGIKLIFRMANAKNRRILKDIEKLRSRIFESRLYKVYEGADPDDVLAGIENELDDLITKHTEGLFDNSII